MAGSQAEERLQLFRSSSSELEPIIKLEPLIGIQTFEAQGMADSKARVLSPAIESPAPDEAATEPAEREVKGIEGSRTSAWQGRTRGSSTASLSVGQIFLSRAEFDAACRAYGRSQVQGFEGCSIIQQSKKGIDTVDFVCTAGSDHYERGKEAEWTGYCNWRIRAELCYDEQRAVRELKIKRFFPDEDTAPKHCRHPESILDKHAQHPLLFKAFADGKSVHAFFKPLVGDACYANGSFDKVKYSASVVGCKDCTLEYGLELNAMGQWVVWRVRPDHDQNCSFSRRQGNLAAAPDKTTSMKRRVEQVEQPCATNGNLTTSSQSQASQEQRTERTRLDAEPLPKRPRLTISSREIGRSFFDLVEELRKLCGSKEPSKPDDLSATPSASLTRQDALFELAWHLHDGGLTARLLPKLSFVELCSLLPSDPACQAQNDALLQAAKLAYDLPQEPYIFDGNEVQDILSLQAVDMALCALHRVLGSPAVRAFCQDKAFQWATFVDAERLRNEVEGWALAKDGQSCDLSTVERVVLYFRLDAWRQSLLAYAGAR